MQRYFEIKNFRNLGIKEPQRLIINTSLKLDSLGNVIYLVGPNNSGKSNVLDALERFGSNLIAQTDIPDFDDSDPHPELKFVSFEADSTYSQIKTLKDQTNDSGFTIVGPNQKTYEYSDLTSPTINFVKATLEWLRNQGHSNKSFYTRLITAINTFDYKTIRALFPELNTFVIGNWGANFYITYINGNKEQIDLCLSDLDLRKHGISSKYQEKYGYNLIPNIIRLKNSDIKQSQFRCNPSEIKSNKFFVDLFNIIQYNPDELVNSYSKFNARNTRGTLVNTQDKINTLLSKVSDQFNKLYLLGENKYRFEIILDSNLVNFQIYLDKLTLNYDAQSAGFKWFFNFYVTLVSQKNLSFGDIIIMDEPATNLHAKGVEELRDFIREYAKKSKLIFIISTHSPFFIDVDYLENVRIVNRIGNESVIHNKFSLLSNNDVDSLGHIKNALTVGRHILLDPTKRTIFVEGITDYCYLTAFKHYNNINDLVFLPIDGLNDEKEPKTLKSDKDLFDSLIKIEKYPVLLVDSDAAGNNAKKRAEAKYKGRIEVLLLSDLLEGCNQIEDLFSADDKVKKSFEDAVSFKDKVSSSKISQITKSNFSKLLDRLRD